MKHFHPGQYVSFTDLKGKSIGFFSIASAPADLPFIWLYARASLHCEEGQSLLLSNPSGQLVLDPNEVLTPYIFCAGGTGITPFLSITKSFPLYRNWNLVWSIVEERDRLMLNEISSETQKRFQIGLYPKEDDRYLFESILLNKLQSNSILAKYFLAGPMVFIEKVGAFLIEQGVNPKNIFSDLKKFVGPLQVPF